MGKKYLETKKDSLESSVLGVWKTAIEEGDARETAVVDGRTKSYKEHQAKLETARQRREEKKVNKEEVDLEEMEKENVVENLNLRDTIKNLWIEAASTAVDPKDREELDKEPDGRGGVESAKNIKRAKEPAPNVSEELDEASGDKEAYKKFFDAALKKFKINSPADLKSDEEKKKFYDYIDAGWEGDNEKAEAAMSQVREYKIQSMKAALAQVWGMEEGKNPFKTEDHDDDDEKNKKRVKTETGKKPAVIDLKPKIDDK
jgi:hypothetical protein